MPPVSKYMIMHPKEKCLLKKQKQKKLYFSEFEITLKE